MSYNPQPIDLMSPGTFVAGPIRPGVGVPSTPGVPRQRTIQPSDLPEHLHKWADIGSTPKTVAGYGIEDALPTKDAKLEGKPTAPTPALGELSDSKLVANVEFTHKVVFNALQGGTVGIGNEGGTTAIYIGTSNTGKLINIGGPNDTVNISGKVTYVQASVLEITDKNIVVNKGGVARTAASSGMDVEEAGQITGYIRVSGVDDREAWDMKAPGRGGILRFKPSMAIDGVAEFESKATAKRIYIFPDKDIAVAGLDSPAFVGTPTSPTPNLGDNTERIATTHFTVVALDHSGFGRTEAVSLAMPTDVFAVTLTETPTTAEGRVKAALAASFNPQPRAMVFAAPSDKPGVPKFLNLEMEHLPISGVIPGTYTKFNVDSKGRVTKGFNPTTMAEYGIEDAAPKVNANLTGTPQADTPAVADNSRRIANTMWVRSLIAATDPLMDGLAIPGSTGFLSDAGHRHPSDTSRVKTIGVPEFGGGPLSKRPAAAIEGRVWVDTDHWIITRDNGTAWVDVLPALEGDITTPANSKVTTLIDKGVAGTYSKVKTDTKGRVIEGGIARVKSPLRFYYENILDVLDQQPALRIDAPGVIKAVRYFRNNTLNPTQPATIEVRKINPQGAVSVLYTVNIVPSGPNRQWLTVSTEEVPVAEGDTIWMVVTQAGEGVSDLTVQVDAELNTLV